MDNKNLFACRILTFSPAGEKTQEHHQTDDPKKFEFQALYGFHEHDSPCNEGTETFCTKNRYASKEKLKYGSSYSNQSEFFEDHFLNNSLILFKLNGLIRTSSNADASISSLA